MTPQDNLNNNLIEAVKECNLIKVKHLIEQGLIFILIIMRN
jgi:hypothetical protein